MSLQKTVMRSPHHKWLGSLPDGWEVVPLKFVAEVFPSNVDKHSREGEIPVRLCNYTDVYYNDAIADDFDFMKATATADQVERFRLRAGDTIITKDSESADDIGLSAYVPADLDGVVCGYHLSMIRPGNRLVGRYVKRLFDSHYVKAILETSANGLTRVGLGQYALDNIDVPLPPVPVQTAITDFLDRETAKIDALIAKQEQLIATLREDRAATITQAVTKGLDANVEMKDTGVEWLGAVPIHWTVSRFSRHVAINGGQVDPRVDPYCDMALIAPNHVAAGTGKLLKLETAAEQGADSGKYLVSAGQVIYSKIRPNLSKAVIAPVDCLCSADMYGLSAEPKQLQIEYLLYMLLSKAFTDYVVDSSMRVAMPKVNHESLGAAPVWIPPLDEQVAISKFVRSRCDSIDALIDKSTEMIETLREYRSALITDAVTGKIDVREVS